MNRINLIALLPLLTSIFDYFSPDKGIGDADLLGTLPYLPGPFPSKTYSGYIDISPDKSIHYVFTESQNDPVTDPIIVWYQGGPGCSSMGGFFAEIGPFIPDNISKGFKLNDNAWNKKANVLFIDQPVGTSYSIGRTH